uniref:Uncharacterized protein n=1 Tax=Oryza glumipatula TaxID=40148 RepID=A0A0E0ALI8_9ORYZ
MPLASLFLDLLFLPLASAQLGRGQTTPRGSVQQQCIGEELVGWPRCAARGGAAWLEHAKEAGGRRGIV